MRFYTNQHQFYCGIDLHARSLSVCVLKQDGAMLLHRNMPAAPEPFLQAVAPYRDGLVVAVACLFTWYGLADLCADAGIPFVLGHALSMKVLPGGTAKNDQIDSHKIAALLRGGMLPHASVSPAQMRATRDVLRRRTHRLRKRTELLAQVPHTTSQYTRPALGKNIADNANREGVAERCDDRAVPKTIAVDLALITYYDELLKDLELFILQTAKHHDPQTLSLRHTVPGLGTILRRVLLDAIHRIARFPSGQECASDARLVTCRKEAGGTRLGTSGKQIGHAPLQWAFSEAATLCLRNTPPGQKLLARLEKKHATGTALSILAHQLGRAVSCMLKRQVACDMASCLQTCGSRAGEPGASLDSEGLRLSRACPTPSLAASGHARARRGRVSLSPRD
jgi:transposase